MKSHLPLFSILAAFLLGCFFVGTVRVATSQPRLHHHAPWESPVAWSKTVHSGGAAIQVDIAPGALDLNHRQVIGWIRTAARAVSEYYGRFPVPRARVLVIPVADRHGVLSGTTWGAVDGFSAFSRMRLGEHTTAADLNNDWTMTHEFVHTALPSLSPDHHWLEEGLATYVEPIARAQIGTLSPQFVWKETVEGMPKGEPLPGEHGLDHTHTWASTYWGGALFCLMADVTIRERTGDRDGLQDALRGILAAGGSIAVDWPISKVIAVADRATGTSVLSDLYKKMGETSYSSIDLDALWARLGIHVESGNIVFDNRAPLAQIRQTITRPSRQSVHDRTSAVDCRPKVLTFLRSSGY